LGQLGFLLINLKGLENRGVRNALHSIATDTQINTDFSQMKNQSKKSEKICVSVAKKCSPQHTD
jgi:hypothetical protein